MRFDITVKKGADTLAVILGAKEVRQEDFTMADIVQVNVTEATLERLTGLRFHIQMTGE